MKVEVAYKLMNPLYPLSEQQDQSARTAINDFPRRRTKDFRSSLRLKMRRSV